jgi:hypothetical protein
MPVISDSAAILAAPSPDASVSAPAPSPQPQSSELPNQIPSVPVPAQPAPQAPAQSAIPAHIIQDSLVGKGVRAMAQALHGQETRYAVDPQTGTMQETTVPAKPGAWARNMLLGAMIGSVAGSGGHGFLQGVTRGAVAGQGQAQEQDETRRQQAQQQFQNQLKAQQNQREQSAAEQEQLLHAATIAHANLQILIAQHQLHGMDADELAKRNTVSKAYEDILKNTEGSKPVEFQVDGKELPEMTADQFAAESVKNPALMRSPTPDYNRVFVDVNDATQLHWNGTTWTDDAGDPVNMSAHSTIRAYDLPTKTMRTGVMIAGRDLLQIRPELKGVISPDQSYSTTPEAVIALKTQGDKDAATRALAAERNNRAANAGAKRGTPAQFAAVEARKAEALSRAEKQYTKDGDADALTAAKTQAQSAYEKEVTALGGSVTSTAPPSGNVDRALNLIGKLPKAQQAAQIKSSTKLSAAEKKQALTRIGAE